MDREAIERRDFPIGRRGYDQKAVDEHLRRVADEIEALRASPGARAAPQPLSAGASEQVRAILEAAETGAAALRAQAGSEAGEHVARVEEAAGGMLARLDELEAELSKLLAALRRSGERLNEGLAALHREVSEFGGGPQQDLAPTDGETQEDFAVATEEDFAAATAPRPDEAPARADGDDAGARLIALNMALSGTPREETARYLAEHYALPDAAALLDDVYARAEQ